MYKFLNFVCMKTTRTNIELRDDVIQTILQLGAAKTKREAVDKALEMYSNWLKRQKLRSLRGKIKWEGDLMKMREGRL